MLAIKKLKSGFSLNNIIDRNARLIRGMLHLSDNSAIELLEKTPINEYNNRFSGIVFTKPSAVEHIYFLFHLYFKKKLFFMEGELSLEVKCDVKNWNNPFSIAKYMKAVKERDVDELFSEVDDFIFDDSLTQIMQLNSFYDTIGKADNSVKYLNKICLEAYDDLSEFHSSEVLSTIFTFPENLRTPCTQYLVYFAQFLKDMGIEVSTEIKENEGQTLFSVIPQNKDEALIKIKEALDIYLDAPGFNAFETSVNVSPNIASLQWASNVSHLKSQLALAFATTQAKDASIQALNATIQSLQLSNFQLAERVQLENDDKTKKEDIIKDVLTVTKYKGKGFELNFPEILRRLKRL